MTSSGFRHLLYRSATCNSQHHSETLHRLLQSGQLGVMTVSRDGQVLDANELVTTTLDLHGSDLKEVPELWAVLDVNKAELANGDTLSMEFEISSRRHLVAMVKEVKRLLLPNYYLLTVADKTEEQVAKEAVVSATEQLRRILANSSDLVFVLDNKLNVTFANETSQHLLSTSSAMLAERPIYEVLRKDDRKSFMRALELLNAQGRNEISLRSVVLQGDSELTVSCRLISLARKGYAFICQPEQTLASIEEEKSAEARFSEVFHGNPDAILIIRAEDIVILDFNEGFTRLLGYSREQAIGESIEAQFWANPSDRAAMIEKLRQEREVIGHETMLRTADGRIVHVDLSLRYMNIDGELCILCIGRDISKRISAEAALVESEEKFEKVFTQSPDGILIIRQSDNTIFDLNEAFLERSGYQRDEMIGQDMGAFMPTDIDPAVLKDMSIRIAQDGRLVNHFIMLHTKSGEPVPSLISATVLELGGEPYTMIIAKDIKKQRATEERLRRSEQRFRGIFENAPIGILLLDLSGRVFQANHTAAKLLAYDEQHMPGLHISRLFPEAQRVGIKQSLQELTSSTTTYKSEHRLVCQNGLETWSNVNIAMQRTSSGEPDYYIMQLADISDLKRGQEQMEQLAFYDTLTNLANRRLFQDRLEQTIQRCQRYNRSAALLYLDLDNFKRVNDTLGHQIGDELLREVANRLLNCVRKEDTVGRSGGDEFTIVLNEISTPADAGQVAQKILNHLREPIEVGRHPLVVTTSIGITILPSDGENPNVLMGNADLAMYKAKERGRNNYQFYSDDLNQNAASRLRTEYEIRQAIEENQFELFYQPKVDLNTQQIVAVESLIRWNHPTRGLLAPNEFIPIAEETGSIIDIGAWVIEAACIACRQIQESTGQAIDVAVNISPRQFRDPNLVNNMRRSIREQGLNPNNIEAEITETMLMQDVEAAHNTVVRLTELGIQLAIDDFGTGYSSLNYLRRFPIDTVKIDRSFVMELPDNKDDMAITKAVIAMAHQLKMAVVAEGVETREQMEFLQSQDCEYAQGYLFSKPIPFAEIVALIKQLNQQSKSLLA